MLTFVYPPTLDFTRTLWQRPQQLARSLAARGHRFLFAENTQTPGRGIEPAPGFPGVEIIHDWNAFLPRLGPEHVLLASWAKHHDLCGRAGLTVFDSLDAFPEWEQWERAMVERADIVLCTSDLIRKSTEARRSDTIHMVPNACDPSHWRGFSLEPSILAAIPRPRVLFSGYFGSWVDAALIDDVAFRCPDLQFVFVGPDLPALQMMNCRGNVHLIPQQAYENLPVIYAACDVGVIPFNATMQVALAADPIKQYEYLAAGLPVLATPIPEAVRMAPHVRTEQGGPAWANALREILAGENAATKAARRQAVAQHTWAERAERIERIVLEALTVRGVAA